MRHSHAIVKLDEKNAMMGGLASEAVRSGTRKQMVIAHLADVWCVGGIQSAISQEDVRRARRKAEDIPDGNKWVIAEQQGSKPIKPVRSGRTIHTEIKPVEHARVVDSVVDKSPAMRPPPTTTTLLGPPSLAIGIHRPTSSARQVVKGLNRAWKSTMSLNKRFHRDKSA